MVIVRDLTTEVALARIGDVALLQDKLKIDREFVEREYKLQQKGNLWDFEWTLSEGSSYVIALKRLNILRREIIRCGEISLDDDPGVIPRELRRGEALAYTAAGTSELAYAFARRELYTPGNPQGKFFRAGGGLGADPLREGIANAIEHGSNYCTTGEVRVRLIGGSKGLAMLVDDPGKEVFDLVPRPRFLRDTEIIVSGKGILSFSRDKDADVGLEHIDYGNRLIFVYDRPSRLFDGH